MRTRVLSSASRRGRGRRRPRRGRGASIMDRDRRGRRRQPDQERGLRPLHPLLPRQWTSKALAGGDVARRTGAVRGAGPERVAPQAPTQARAHGIVLSRLIDEAAARPARPRPARLDGLGAAEDLATAAFGRLTGVATRRATRRSSTDGPRLDRGGVRVAHRVTSCRRRTPVPSVSSLSRRSFPWQPSFRAT